MIVSPVSNVVSNSSYNANFVGKRNKKSDIQPQPKISAKSSAVKAIPLMTLLAMTPISVNNLQAEEKSFNNNSIELIQKPQTDTLVTDKGIIIGSKTFPKYNNADVIIRSKNGKDASAVEVILKGIQGDPCPTDLLSFVNYNMALYSDDGVNVNTYRIPELKVKLRGRENYDNIKNWEIAEYVSKFVSKDNKDIPVIDVNSKFRLQYTGKVDNKTSGEDRMKNAVPADTYGTCVGGNDFETDRGKYRINYYSTDDNDDNAEVITVKKEGYPELKVFALVRTYGYFCKSSMQDPLRFEQGIISLYGADRQKQYTYLDPELYNALIQVKSHDCIDDHAFIWIDTEPKKYDMVENGVVYEMIDREAMKK